MSLGDLAITAVMAQVDFQNSSWLFVEDAQKADHFAPSATTRARTPLMRSVVGEGVNGERVEYRGGEGLTVLCARSRYREDSKYRFKVMVCGAGDRMAWVDPRDLLVFPA